MFEQFTHQTYLSPFTWRYGSAEMRQLWSEAHKRRLWRRLWVALAEAQQAAGLVTQAQVDDLRRHAGEVDVDRAHQIEAEIHHDLMAEVKTFAIFFITTHTHSINQFVINGEILAVKINNA